VANRILIIQPSHDVSIIKKTLQKSKRRPLESLVLPYLAARTHGGWGIWHSHEQSDDLDFSSKPDRVAMTCWTMHAERGSDVAARLRKQAIPLVMGGPHAV
jgi:hypothetical protein